MDRIAGQSIHLVLEEIFDPDFTAGNFGFRKGKSQHQAIRYVREHVKKGKEWRASIDLKSFFDEIPHDLILKLIRLPDPGIPELLARPRCVDTEPITVHAAEEVEETTEVATDHDSIGFPSTRSSPDLGQDEQMAVGAPERGPFCTEP